ncbi:unnamed protein product [Dracunculus medinensis]|uniref:Uncharacterized protein n=1 Tax=Dracunculus medinensis TaxID=318479 RepID=A0A0N4UG07_DRAME|nr:unnamed protein product [Dracunculus medinensis]
MSAYSSTTTGHHYNLAQQNVYVRENSGDSEIVSLSSKRNDHKLIDAFRERLNFRSHRDSPHSSTIDVDMLEEDLGYPPTCDDPPPDCENSLYLDSAHNSDFRSRSRSDAASHSFGTIVLFPNRSTSENASLRTVHRVRAERHSICSSGLDDICETKPSTDQTWTSTSFPKAPHHDNLYIDTKLANENIAHRRRNINQTALPLPSGASHSFPVV